MPDDRLTFSAIRCIHGSWHPHNAFLLDDGSVVDDPEGQCPGGVVSLKDGPSFHISHALAMFLDRVTADVNVDAD